MHNDLSEEPKIGSGSYEAKLAAVHEYAKRGWAVMPVWGIENGECACEGRGCTSPGKHPATRDWASFASSGAAKMCSYLKIRPSLNIGVVTGPASGTFAMDSDGLEGGASLSRLEAQYGKLPHTLTAETSRGMHFYFKHPGRPVKTTAGVIGKGLDVRGNGAYIIAPPSLHVSGWQYRWVDGTVDVAEAPAWLLDLVCSDAPVDEAVCTPETDGTIVEGSRNQTLFKHGCGMRGGGASQEEIEDALLRINERACQPPLQAPEVTQVAKSAAKYAPGSTRNAGAITGDGNYLKWFPFDTPAWRRNPHVLLMPDYQVGWYIWLIVECWDRGGYLPSNPELLAKLARAGKPKRFYTEMTSLLAEFEVTENETALVHLGLRAEYEDRARKVEKKREAGHKRWENERSSRSLIDEGQKS